MSQPQVSMTFQNGQFSRTPPPLAGTPLGLQRGLQLSSPLGYSRKVLRGIFLGLFLVHMPFAPPPPPPAPKRPCPWGLGLGPVHDSNTSQEDNSLPPAENL